MIITIPKAVNVALVSKNPYTNEMMFLRLVKCTALRNETILRFVDRSGHRLVCLRHPEKADADYWKGRTGNYFLMTVFIKGQQTTVESNYDGNLPNTNHGDVDIIATRITDITVLKEVKASKRSLTNGKKTK